MVVLGKMGVVVMKARDVMVPHVITVQPDLDVKAVANTLVANGISAVPVVAIDGSIVGIISEGDLMRRIVASAVRKRPRWLEIFSSPERLMAEFAKSHGRKAADVMTRQVISVDPDTSLQDIAHLLEKHGIKRVPVIENGRLVGIVSRANLVQVLASRGVAFVDRAESEEALRNAIISNLRKLPLTGAMTSVDVTVDRGIVNLWGVVHNEEEKNAIRIAIERTPGVQEVNDHLRIYLS
jgi:CBS domain-containing protein